MARSLCRLVASEKQACTRAGSGHEHLAMHATIRAAHAALPAELSMASDTHSIAFSPWSHSLLHSVQLSALAHAPRVTRIRANTTRLALDATMMDPLPCDGACTEHVLKCGELFTKGSRPRCKVPVMTRRYQGEC